MGSLVELNVLRTRSKHLRLSGGAAGAMDKPSASLRLCLSALPVQIKSNISSESTTRKPPKGLVITGQYSTPNSLTMWSRKSWVFARRESEKDRENMHTRACDHQPVQHSRRKPSIGIHVTRDRSKTADSHAARTCTRAHTCTHAPGMSRIGR